MLRLYKSQNGTDRFLLRLMLTDPKNPCKKEFTMKKITGLLSLAMIGGCLAASLPAKADTYFRDSDRVILRHYVTTTTTTTTTSTPTSTSTATPTKRTVTYYTPGTVLPDTVTYTELPSEVTTQLMMPPSGSKYIIIEGNAYLLDPEKRVIIDAESLEDDE
jgi:hypothetical protein